MNTTEFTVTGMTCSNCESHVREEVSGVSGVTSLEVSAATSVLRVSADGPVDEAAVIAAVDEAGYTAVVAA
ncbi:heavy-metal-associated domain-containing protein [Leucobacter sp. BZR 635]